MGDEKERRYGGRSFCLYGEGIFGNNAVLGSCYRPRRISPYQITSLPKEKPKVDFVGDYDAITELENITIEGTLGSNRALP